MILPILFLPNPNNLPVVDHIDRIKSNCAVSNLRWATRKENAENVDEDTIFGSSRSIFKCDLLYNILYRYSSAREAFRENPTISYDDIRGSANGKNIPNQEFIWVWENDKADPYEALEGEIFKQAVGDFDGYIVDLPNYHISNFGSIVNRDGLKLKYRLINGYPTSCLYNKSKKFNFLIHRLVALFFVEGRTAERNIVNHLDEDRTNFHYTNLEWCTYAENSFHSRYKNAKAVKQIDCDTGEVLATFKSQRDACRSVSGKETANLSAAISGLTKTAYGYKWERVTDMNDVFF